MDKCKFKPTDRSGLYVMIFLILVCVCGIPKKSDTNKILKEINNLSTILQDSSIIEVQIQNKSGYPCLMEYAYQDSGYVIVLFEKPNRGMVLWVKYPQEHGRYVGEYRTDWVMESFLPTDKKILISNRWENGAQLAEDDKYNDCRHILFIED